MDLIRRIGIRLPIIQAPMAGVSTPQLAAAVSNAGGLGSLGIGASTPQIARELIETTRTLTNYPFQVNLFVHSNPKPNEIQETAWLEYLKPLFQEFGETPPKTLRTIYKSFADDSEMLAMLLETRPPVVSFHFGLPSTQTIQALKEVGTVLLASATNLVEARMIEKAGLDGIVAQGYEAGGHRGVFDPQSPDSQLGVFPLTRLLVQQTSLPVISAGGIMDGAGISAVLKLGAVAAQLGTAFIGCPESSADQAYRNALSGQGGHSTVMTRLISGRPARSLSNRFTSLTDTPAVPDYPIAYDAGKALHSAAKAKGEFGYGAQWAGQGALLSRAMPAGELMRALEDEFNALA